MDRLNLPDYTPKLKINSANKTLFDSFRKKRVKLTPEEWVRQCFLYYMVEELNYPAGLLSVEMQLSLNKISYRCDIVAFDANKQAKLIVECKAASIKINQNTFNQIATYNLELNVDYLIVTNGLQHYCCKVNQETRGIEFLRELPTYEQITEG